MLGLKPRTSFAELVGEMVRADLAAHGRPDGGVLADLPAEQAPVDLRDASPPPSSATPSALHARLRSVGVRRS